MGGLRCSSIDQFCIILSIWIFSIFRYQIPEKWPYQEARQLFKEPVALTDEEQLEIKWTAPDEEVRNPSWKLLYDNPSSTIDSGKSKYFNWLDIYIGADFFSGEWKWIQ